MRRLSLLEFTFKFITLSKRKSSIKFKENFMKNNGKLINRTLKKFIIFFYIEYKIEYNFKRICL